MVTLQQRPLTLAYNVVQAVDVVLLIFIPSIHYNKRHYVYNLKNLHFNKRGKITFIFNSKVTLSMVCHSSDIMS